MINTNTSVASLLSNIYQSNGASLADSLSKIASGKRVQTPGDDFAGYIRASGLNADISGYNAIKQDLQDAKSLVTYSQSVGNNIVQDLSRLKELSANYTAANGDANRQSGYKAEYDQIIQRITDTKANSYYDTTKVYQSSTGLKSVAINTANTSIIMNIATTANDTANEAAISNITTATTAGIQSEINNAEKYVSEMQSFGTQLDRNLKLADTIISSKQATVSAIMDVDEAQEMSKVTNLQIRQQATAAMMAQANSAQVAIARLFQ
jgi:flagellin